MNARLPAHRARGPRRLGRYAALLHAVLALSPAFSPALAQNPAAQQIPLGRLFHTPQQREELDRRRQLNIQEAPVVAVENQYTVNGHVSRSSGRSTTWVNGTPQNDAFRSQDVSVIPMAPGEGENRVDVKVGQTLETGSGEIRDRLQGGEIKIQRAPRAGP